MANIQRATRLTAPGSTRSGGASTGVARKRRTNAHSSYAGTQSGSSPPRSIPAGTGTPPGSRSRMPLTGGSRRAPLATSAQDPRSAAPQPLAKEQWQCSFIHAHLAERAPAMSKG